MYADYAAAQLLHFTSLLEDSRLGLLHHGFDQARSVQSCCMWGRGNGWAVMAITDLLLVLRPSHPRYEALMGRYINLTHALVAVQDTVDGRWHDLLNDPTTVHETSCTAFFLYAFAHGLKQDWLPADPFRAALVRGWAGLAAQIQADGSVVGIAGKTGIKASAAEYSPGPMPYPHSAPGLGAVLRAVAALAGSGL